MMNRTFRPVALTARSLRALSTSSRITTSRSSLYFGTAAATLGLAAIGYNNAISEKNTILNDTTGSANWKPEVGQYNEDLKVNRHKIAAQHGATPESPLHNSKHSDNTHHVGTSKVTGEGENIRRGDGLQEKSVPGLVPDLADKAKKDEGEGKVESAYNEETGEINWDCPCLGGMAQGPCGEDFKAAFSCFIHSEEEPKGLDCVEKFKAMQDCFRKHPDIYGEEIDEEAPEPIGQPTSTDGPGPLSAATVSGSPLPADHPDQDKVPRKPKTSPPEHSEIPKQTHLNNPAKGIEKIQPKGDRADKKGKGPGDGTI